MKRKNAGASQDNDQNEFLDVKMSRKLIFENSQKALYEFTVILVKENQSDYKITKSYPEFVEIEAYVVDIINNYSNSNKMRSPNFPLLSKN